MADREIQRRPDGTFAAGESGALKHGGESAVSAIREGRAFKGLAAMAEAEVRADFETEGRAVLVHEIAVRLHTAMRLYWAAVQSATDKGDLAQLDVYMRRFGWLAGIAGRAWRDVKQEQGDGDSGILEAALRDAREIGDGNDS